MIYHNLRISRATISTLTNCKLIVRCGVGFDNVDHVLARSKGIPVANVPDYGTEEVADSAIGLMLSLTRGIHLLNQRLQHGDGAWTYLHAAPIVRLRGRVFAIIGLGRIGGFPWKAARSDTFLLWRKPGGAARLVEDAADFAHQILRPVRLRDRAAHLRRLVGEERLAAVAAGEEHAHRRVQLDQLDVSFVTLGHLLGTGRTDVPPQQPAQLGGGAPAPGNLG